MPAGLRWFAEHQPFTPVIEAVRSLLAGDPSGHDARLAIAWCAAIMTVGLVWSLRLYNREPRA